MVGSYQKIYVSTLIEAIVRFYQ